MRTCILVIREHLENLEEVSQGGDQENVDT
jgi:hypothetical protein